MESTPARKGTVQTVAQALQQLGLVYADTGMGSAPLPRPFLGGQATGFHAMPSVGDQVAVVHEAWSRPLLTLSATDSPEALPLLAAGECAIYAPDGTRAYYLKSDGSAVVVATTTGAVISVNASGDITLSSAPGRHVIINGTPY